MDRLLKIIIISCAIAVLSSCNLKDNTLKGSLSPEGEDEVETEVLFPKVFENSISQNLPTHTPTYDISPDGTKILYRGNGLGGPSMFLRDLSGGTTINLSPIPSNEILRHAFSPDSNLAVFNFENSVYTLNTDGTNYKKQYSDNTLDSFPRFMLFSPDSQYLMTVNDFTQQKLRVIDLIGNSYSYLDLTSIFTFNSNYRAKFVPDSSKIILMNWSERIYTLNLDATGLAQFVSTPRPSFYCTSECLQFSADNNWLITEDGGRINRAPISGLVAPTDLTFPNFMPYGHSFTMLPDRSKVLFVADTGGNDEDTIWSMNSDGTNQVDILGGISTATQKVHADSSGLVTFKPTNDGAWVTYIADIATNEQYELYSVPAAGGASVKLNGAMQPLGDVLGAGLYEISDNSQKVVYAADKSVDGLFELYSVSINGTSRVKLSPAMTFPDLIKEYKISPDSSKVAFVISNSIGGYELYSINIDGSILLKLDETISSSFTISDINFSGDSSKIIYIAEKDFDGLHDIYSANADGTSVSKISGNPNQLATLNGDISDDGEYFFYLNLGNLYSYNLRTGDKYEVHKPANAALDVSAFVVDSQNKKLILRGDLEVNGQFELFICDFDGGNYIKLNHIYESVGNDLMEFTHFPSLQKIVYRVNENTFDNIHAVNYDSTGYVKLNPALVAGGNVTEFKASDAGRVVYKADAEVNALNELYAVDIDGGNPSKLSQGAAVYNYLVTSDGSKAVLVSDEDSAGVKEVYSVDTDGNSWLKISDVFAGTADATKIFLSPNDQTIVYWADQDTDDIEEAYSVNIDGSNKQKLSSAPSNYYFTAPDDTVNAHLSNDGYVYRRAEDDEYFKIYFSPYDGTGSVNIMSTLDPDDEAESDFVVSAGKVIFRVRRSLSVRTELFSANLDGSSLTQLSHTMSGSGGVPSFSVTDTGKVLFLQDVDGSGTYDLYGVAVDGSGSISKVSTDVSSGQSVRAFVNSESRAVILRSNSSDDLSENSFLQYGL